MTRVGAEVVRLHDVRASDVHEVGGKAASLGELIASGVRVPDGVVLTAEAAASTAEARQKLLGAIVAELGAGPFAVRSSGIAEDGAEQSYAGMFDTVLEVGTDDLSAAVDRTLASAHAGRVASYGSDGHRFRMAVIVQRLVDAAAAGVALTADPMTGDRAVTLVTAVKGLGDRLVSGEAFGDEFVIRANKVERKSSRVPSTRARRSRSLRKPAGSQRDGASPRTSNGPSIAMGACGFSRPGR